MLGSREALNMEALLYHCYSESNFYGRQTLGRLAWSENMRGRSEAVLTGEMKDQATYLWGHFTKERNVHFLTLSH